MTAFPASTKFNADNTVDYDEHRQLLADVNSAAKELLGGSSEEELTITTGAVPAPTSGAIRILGEGGSPDTLQSIPTTNHPDGRYLIVRAANASQGITLTESGGNLSLLYGGGDFVLDALAQTSLFQRDGADWAERARWGRPRVVVADGADPLDVAFNAAWTGGAYAMRWFLNPSGMVEVFGFASNSDPEGDSAVILTLPATHRPPSTAGLNYFPVHDALAGGPQGIIVASTGVVTFVRVTGAPGSAVLPFMAFSFPTFL